MSSPPDDLLRDRLGIPYRFHPYLIWRHILIMLMSVALRTLIFECLETPLMNRYTLERWTRLSIGLIAFAMALVLTPRAILDVGGAADSHEIPVDLLDPFDDCLWCTPQIEFEADDCPGDTKFLHNPDRIDSDDVFTSCPDDGMEPTTEPSI